MHIRDTPGARQRRITGTLTRTWLQPLAGDWRERVKARGASPEDKAQPSSAPRPSSKARDGRPDLAELSRGLPGGWKALWDPKQQQVYFGNARTKVCGRAGSAQPSPGSAGRCLGAPAEASVPQHAWPEHDEGADLP